MVKFSEKLSEGCETLLQYSIAGRSPKEIGTALKSDLKIRKKKIVSGKYNDTDLRNFKLAIEMNDLFDRSFEAFCLF